VQDRIWKPEVNYVNENSPSGKTAPSSDIITLFSGGVVNRQTFSKTTFSAKFDLTYFPYDYQDLFVQLAVRPQGLTDIQLRYIPANLNDVNTSTWLLLYDRSIQSSPFPGYTAYEISMNYIFARVPYPFVFKYLVPLIFITMCSCLTYYVDVAAVPARATMSLTLLLSTITLSFIISAEIPKLRGITVMDQYMLTTMTFVVISLVEFIFIHFLKNNGYAIVSSNIEFFFRIATLPIALGMFALWFEIGQKDGQVGQKTPFVIIFILVWLLGCVLYCVRRFWVEYQPYMKVNEEMKMQEAVLPSIKGDHQHLQHYQQQQMVQQPVLPSQYLSNSANDQFVEIGANDDNAFRIHSYIDRSPSGTITNS
jgi:hypothetical protein